MEAAGVAEDTWTVGGVAMAGGAAARGGPADLKDFTRP
jgi:hypothetical protein